MKLDLFLLPRAQADLDSHCIYLAENADIETALRFDQAAFASFNRLCEMPLVGSEREYLNLRLHELRMWPVNSFDHYLIFYRVLDNAIQVVRVLHSSRDIEGIISDEKIN